jgi:hypothetical protein
VRALDIDVERSELVQWLEWLMPTHQPFLVPHEHADRLGLDDRPERLTMELRDSFWIYGDQDDAVCWLDRAGSRALPADVRRAQPERHRWRTRDEEADLARLVRYLEDGRRPSCHREVAAATWRACESLLPGARALAGTFPGRSGPNCFGTVMGAAGVVGAAQTWVVREPFEDWLADAAVAGGSDGDAGTVLVWRSPDGLVQHAAVTLGDGFALHKPSQGWQSPTKVLTVQEAKMSARAAGRHLHRYRLREAVG